MAVRVVAVTAAAVLCCCGPASGLLPPARRPRSSAQLRVGSSSGDKGGEQTRSLAELQAEFQATASDSEVEVDRQLELGLACLRAGLVGDSLVAFDAALALEPDTQIWQRGISLFFLGRFEDAQAQFTTDGARFAQRWSMPATEETIWAAAALHQRCPVGADLSECFAPLPFPETNPMLATIHDVFVGQRPVEALQVQIAAQIEANARMVNMRVRDPMGRLALGHFYLGLWFDAAEGDVDSACEQMARAADLGDDSNLRTSLASNFPELVKQRGLTLRDAAVPLGPAPVDASAAPPLRPSTSPRDLLSSVEDAVVTVEEAGEPAASSPEPPPPPTSRPLMDVVADIKATLGVESSTMVEALVAAEAEMGLPHEGTVKDRATTLARELGVPTETDTDAGPSS